MHNLTLNNAQSFGKLTLNSYKPGIFLGYRQTTWLQLRRGRTRNSIGDCLLRGIS